MSTTLLRVGDTVRILFNGRYHNKLGTIESLTLDGKYANVRIKDVPRVGCIKYTTSDLELVARLEPVSGTPIEPAKPEPLKDKEFSDKGVMPSDHAGINEMLKKGFKEIFGGELVPAPAKRTLPSSKALFITASEKYTGLGFNDGLAD